MDQGERRHTPKEKYIYEDGWDFLQDNELFKLQELLKEAVVRGRESDRDSREERKKYLEEFKVKLDAFVKTYVNKENIGSKKAYFFIRFITTSRYHFDGLGISAGRSIEDSYLSQALDEVEKLITREKVLEIANAKNKIED